MNRFQHEIVTSLWKQKKYDGIREFLQVMYGKNNVIFEEYDGLRPRLFVNENDDIVLMLPTEMDVVMENAVVDSIENGTIFDDAHVVNNTAKYIRMTGLPYNGLMNKNIDEPKHMVATIGSVIGTMDDKGRFGCDDCDIQNGVNAMKDMMDHSNDEPCATMKLVGNYIDLKKDGKLPKNYRKSLGKVSGEVEKIKEVEADDTVGPDDYRELELTDECGSMCNPVEEEDTVSDDSSTSTTSSTSSDDNTAADTSAVPTDDTSMSNGSSTESSYSDNGPDNSEVQQEGFLSKKPKRLKPIPRDTIAYIQIELNAIKDSNDQAMLAGYTCSKLELVDFYLNCIDTQDDRYIVPHTRQYLVQMQNDLNNLLTKILQVRPMNKMDRVWKVGVTLPDTTWR
jgi:hypothetical protein